VPAGRVRRHPAGVPGVARARRPDVAAGSAGPASASGGCSPFRVRLARDLLRLGGVIAYPTEAVFGLGCLPHDHDALQRIVHIKRRAASKGLILVAASVEQAMRYVEPLDDERMRAVRASWPGPWTWVLPARAGVDPLITGGRASVAVRVTAHPVAASLCRAVDAALVSTSANRSARPPARTALAVRRAFGRQVDAVVPGRVGNAAAPSTIRDGATGRILRE